MSRWNVGGSRDKRTLGRAGVALRQRRLHDHPLCAECQRQGRVTATEEIDHITPLAQGGEDADGNVQGLCVPCHLAKSAREDASHGGAATHPDWLSPSAIPLTIICGPPASGKTTHAKQNAKPGDTIIDLDEIITRRTGRAGHQATGEHLTPAIRERNAILGSLSRMKAGEAWFIVSAPTDTERQWWANKLGGTVLTIDPGQSTCLDRIKARGTQWQAEAVKAWYRPKPWSPPVKRAEKRTIGLDGWPV